MCSFVLVRRLHILVRSECACCLRCAIETYVAQTMYDWVVDKWQRVHPPPPPSTTTTTTIEEAIDGTLRTVKTWHRMCVVCPKWQNKRRQKIDGAGMLGNEVEIAKHYKFGQFGYFSIWPFFIPFFFCFNLFLVLNFFVHSFLQTLSWAAVDGSEEIF